MKRYLRPLAALAVVATISAGCSNPPAASSGADPTVTARSALVKFAECMRTNGNPGFPDPNERGDFGEGGIERGSARDPGTPAFQAALSACQELKPAGYLEKRTPEQQQQALKVAACVRQNGVPDFPDPDPDGPLIDTSRMPGSPAGRSIPGLLPAIERCRGLLEGAVPATTDGQRRTGGGGGG